MLICYETNGDSISNHFKVIKNTAIKTNSLNDEKILASLKMFVELVCISSCNSNSDCLTAVFDSKNDVETPCYLFSKIYNTSELISSLTSNLYLKHGQKISIHFYF